MTVDVKLDRKAQQATEAAKAMAEYRAKEAEVDRNTERLRALRLAREAELAANARAPVPKAAPKPQKATATKPPRANAPKPQKAKRKT